MGGEKSNKELVVYTAQKTGHRTLIHCALHSPSACSFHPIFIACSSSGIFNRICAVEEKVNNGISHHTLSSHSPVFAPFAADIFNRVCAMEEKVGHYIDLCGFLLLLTIFCTILCLQADPTACRQVLAAHEVLLPPVSDRLSWLHQVQLLGSKAVTGCHGCNECDRVSSMVSRNTATGCCSFNLWHNCNSCQPENLLLRPPTVVPTSI